MMTLHKVSGVCKISFSIFVEAETKKEALKIAKTITIWPNDCSEYSPCQKIPTTMKVEEPT